MNQPVEEIYLWPTRILALYFDDRDFHQRLYNFVLSEHGKTQVEGFEYKDEENRLYDIFSFKNPDIDTLGKRVIKSVREYLGEKNCHDWVENILLSGRAVIISDRGFIQTHVERRESDLTIPYFLSGSGSGQALNSNAEPTFIIEDPSRASSDLRFPWEDRQSFSIAPRPGLMLIFPPHIPHHQRPYRGEKPHIQIVCNVKIQFKPDYFKWKK